VGLQPTAQCLLKRMDEGNIDQQKFVSCMLVLASECADIEADERIGALTGMIAPLRMLKASNGSTSTSFHLYYNLLVAVIVSSTRKSQVPLCFLASNTDDEIIWKAAMDMFESQFKKFTNGLSSVELEKVLVFVMELLSTAEGETYEPVSNLRTCLRLIVNHLPSCVDKIEAAHLWEELFH